MSTDNPIIDKIKKLLRLSKSPHAGEAELALAKAHELAARHQLSIQNLPDEKDINEVTEDRTDCPARISRIRDKALSIAINYFNVDVIKTRKLYTHQLAWIGSVHDIQIAQYIYGFVVRSCAQSLSSFGKSLTRRMSARRRISYIDGFFCGIRSVLNSLRLPDSEQNRYAIIMVSQAEKRKQFVAVMIGETTDRKLARSRIDRAARIAGFMAGESTKIPTAMPTAEHTSKAMIGACA